ncbi:MAG TPA: hypothetical protein DCL77_06585 [Prolixibacteraceae bacterium]|jgi:hypothetical protein|nr:hypothetical protein [Prolixibacteraceae bacterium]
MKPDNEIYPVVVYEGNEWEAAMVKSLLANAEIEVFTRDERMGAIAPWYSSPGGAGSVKLIVSNVDLEKAREVVAEFEKAERKS